MEAACSSQSWRLSNISSWITHITNNNISYQLPFNVCIRWGWWSARAWKLSKQPRKCVTFQPQSQTTLSIPNVSHKTFCNRTISSRTGWQAASFLSASLTLLSSQVLLYNRHKTGYILPNKPPSVKCKLDNTERYMYHSKTLGRQVSQPSNSLKKKKQLLSITGFLDCVHYLAFERTGSVSVLNKTNSPMQNYISEWTFNVYWKQIWQKILLFHYLQYLTNTLLLGFTILLSCSVTQVSKKHR